MLLIIICYFIHNYFWPHPWPQPQTFGLGLASISSYYVIGHFLAKMVQKFGNFVNFSGNNLTGKSYVANHYLLPFS